MLEPSNNDELPPIPGKRYFTIGEVSELCAVKPHVLRYWEQEFAQLKPVKRRGNRRYYQHQDVLLIRQIRALLYDQGFTIGGARLQMTSDGADTRATDSKVAEQKNSQQSPVAPNFAKAIEEIIEELESILTLLK